MKKLLLLLATLTAPVLLQAQLPNNSSLSGRYYFVHLLISVPPGGPVSNVRNLGGTITFNGTGGYSYNGQLGSGNGGLAADSGAGAYAVTSSAFVTLSNPLANGVQINGRMGADAEILVGSSTETLDNSYDLFIAIQAPLNEISNFTLNGEYTGATLGFPGGQDDRTTTALLSLSPNGGGLFAAGSARGHSVNADDTTVEQMISNATYNLNSDGSGTASFGTSSTLFSGDHDIFVSATGNYLIGYSTAPGGREIFVAIRNFGTDAVNADWQGDFWWAEIIADPVVGSYSSAAGALRTDGAGTATASERFRTNLVPLDFSGIFPYAIDPDSKGVLAGFTQPDIINMGIGVVSGGRANAFVGAQVVRLGQTSILHGIFFGIRMPELSGSGVFVNPLGVLNGASFAPPTYPVSGGAILSVFGSGLAAATQSANATPLPTTLADVSATINGISAPLILISPTLVQLIVPFATLDDKAFLVVNNNGMLSNEVELLVASSSPGMFSVNQNGLGAGSILHSSDLRLVTEQDPAVVGEFVSVFVTGLGALDPPLGDGEAPPVDPLSFVTDPAVQVLFGFEGTAGEDTVAVAAPFFAGLYQINVRVPNLPVVGPNVPVAIRTSNARSDFADIAVEF